MDAVTRMEHERVVRWQSRAADQPAGATLEGGGYLDAVCDRHAARQVDHVHVYAPHPVNCATTRPSRTITPQVYAHMVARTFGGVGAWHVPAIMVEQVRRDIGSLRNIASKPPA